MERIFEAQNAGYGQMMLGVARTTKQKVSGVFTALKLPRFLVSVLTWGVLISLGLMLAGLVFFVAVIYSMLTNSGQSKADQLADELREEGRQEALARWEYYMHLGDTNDRF
ncbi:hypothetical protein TOI97_02890 [Denitrificimonas sp. JX-1]|uniref:DUF3742 family protein n=1 Tax=Denitrificimonas halotolerans TaxID=3098930 RepID=A0ABU5GNG7_9GAMM|nr:hypothetical protein [Denitrificimonas sp. JX-1]MDY7218529.1 hypothetical protein [Denitrificimonas sp. JX-1]